MEIKITPKGIKKFFIGAIGILVTAHLMGLCSTFLFNHNYVFGLVPMFDLDEEQNIPTWYSSVSLLLSSLLLGMIAYKTDRQKKSYYYNWAILAGIFLFLSIDEFALLHEGFTNPLRETLNLSGYLYFAWVIPYSLLLIGLMIFYYKFLLSLPAKTRNNFILAGLMYITGAVGFDMLGGMQWELYDNYDPAFNFHLYVLYASIEEILEMTGVAIFIYGLSKYIGEELGGVVIKIDT